MLSVFVLAGSEDKNESSNLFEMQQKYYDLSVSFTLYGDNEPIDLLSLPCFNCSNYSAANGKTDGSIGSGNTEPTSGASVNAEYSDSKTQDRQFIPERSDRLSSRRESNSVGYANVNSREYAASIVCSGEYRWSCEWALRVIYCESHYNASVVATEYHGGVTYHFVGWFQVWNGSTDPITNTRQAYKQWLEWQSGIRKTNPWPNCG